MEAKHGATMPQPMYARMVAADGDTVRPIETAADMMHHRSVDMTNRWRHAWSCDASKLQSVPTEEKIGRRFGKCDLPVLFLYVRR
jgi:hypothetical protein